MLRTIRVCERNVFVEPPRPITLAAATSTQVFPNQTKERGEIVTRYIQNNTGADLYLAFDTDTCDGVNQVHVFIANKQLYECFPTRGAVYAYSVGGGKIFTTIIRRYDSEPT